MCACSMDVAGSFFVFSPSFITFQTRDIPDYAFGGTQQHLAEIYVRRRADVCYDRQLQTATILVVCLPAATFFPRICCGKTGLAS